MTAEDSLRAFGVHDGDITTLAGMTIAFIGYGNQGRAQALNLRDSLDRANIECPIIAATLPDETRERAREDGFDVSSASDAARAADILFLLIPDEEQPPVFRAEIAPALTAGKALVFASGYNLTYGEIEPPEGVDVLLLAPRMIGRQLRQLYERDQGFYSYLSVEQDGSGQAWPLLLALAQGIGTLAAGGGAFEFSARNETILDLYHEQGFGSLFGTMFMLMLDVGLKAGIPAEALVLDLYLSGEAMQTLQAMVDVGFYEQSKLHSRTSQYGGMMRTIELDNEPIRKHLEKVVEEVKSGAFYERWTAERDAGYEMFEKLRELAGKANPFTPLEERIRAAFREAHERD